MQGGGPSHTASAYPPGSSAARDLRRELGTRPWDGDPVGGRDLRSRDPGDLSAAGRRGEGVGICRRGSGGRGRDAAAGNGSRGRGAAGGGEGAGADSPAPLSRGHGRSF